MNEDKLALYRIWIPEIRKRGTSPWVSIRMNDLHSVAVEDHPTHLSFRREHPGFRRVLYRGEEQDKALDYSGPEVRDHNFSYLEEACERYDFDTLELEWIWHGVHFRPGYEAVGRGILNQFHVDARRLLDKWQRRRKHPISLAVRMPPSPRTALGLGTHAAAWVRAGHVNREVASVVAKGLPLGCGNRAGLQRVSRERGRRRAELKIELA